MGCVSFRNEWLACEKILCKMPGYPNVAERIKIMNLSNSVEAYEKNLLRIYTRRYVSLLLFLQFIICIAFLFVVVYFILVFRNLFINSHILHGRTF